MADSGVGGRFWFKAACARKNARNVTGKQRLGSTPHTSWMSSCLVNLLSRPRKKRVLVLAKIQVPSQRTLVLNIINIFNSDNSNVRSLGNSRTLVLVPTFVVRARPMSGWSSFNTGFQWLLYWTLMWSTATAVEENERCRTIASNKWLRLWAWLSEQPRLSCVLEQQKCIHTGFSRKIPVFFARDRFFAKPHRNTWKILSLFRSEVLNVGQKPILP